MSLEQNYYLHKHTICNTCTKQNNTLEKHIHDLLHLAVNLLHDGN